MSSFEWNKIIASVLTAIIIAMVAGILARSVVRPTHLEKAAYSASGGETAPVAGQGSRAAPARPEPVDMSKADPKRGEQVARVCLQCHTFEKGGANRIGPNLWAVTEENIASVPGYIFSSALRAEKGKKWDPDELNVWLWKPQEFARGTKMTFAGLPRAQDRADVIAYLQTLK